MFQKKKKIERGNAFTILFEGVGIEPTITPGIQCRTYNVKGAAIPGLQAGDIINHGSLPGPVEQRWLFQLDYDHRPELTGGRITRAQIKRGMGHSVPFLRCPTEGFFSTLVHVVFLDQYQQGRSGFVVKADRHESVLRTVHLGDSGFGYLEGLFEVERGQTKTITIETTGGSQWQIIFPKNSWVISIKKKRRRFTR